MRSGDKVLITVEPYNVDGETKPWAIVRAKDGSGTILLIPSFEDVFRQILAIAYCERVKYDGKLSRDPADMVEQFLVRSMAAARWVLDGSEGWPPRDDKYERAWQQLAREFKMPPRTYTATVQAPTIVTTTTCQPGCTCDLCREWPKVA